MTVTALRQTSPERCTVVLDGTEIKTTLGVVTELRLFVGRELDEAELERLQNASSLSLCRQRALEMVGRRAMSRKELVTKLTEKGESSENAETCADWMVDAGFIDDGVYAGMVVRHYAAKGYGEGRIRSELIRRGVSRELWDEAMREMPEQSDKLQRFIRSRLTDPEDRQQIKKVCDGLLRRGYSYDEIKHALEEFKADIEEY